METKYKHYNAYFTDVMGKAWALVISYPDTEETKRYPQVKDVRLGIPPVTLTTESEDAIAPIVKGRLSFSLLEVRGTERYRHLAQAPEGAVSVYLLELPEQVPTGGVAHLFEALTPWEADRNAFWVGTLDPESYKEPANQDTGYLVSFEASDFGYMSRVTLTKEFAYDDRCDLKPRENLFVLVQKLLKRGLTGWVAEKYKEYRANSANLMAGNVAHCYTRYTGTLYMGAEQTPTVFDERQFLFDTSQFFLDKEEPISVLEALERVLSALGLRIEQAAGTFFITDMSVLDGDARDKFLSPKINNPIGRAWLGASPMEVMGDDGELSLHSSYSNVVVNTRTYLDALSWEMELPKIDSFVPWKRVLRTLSDGTKVGAWSYRTTDIVGEYKQAALLETKAESMGEDNEFYALVWNPKSIHGRCLADAHPRETTLFLMNVNAWEQLPNYRGVYVNKALIRIDENLEIQPFKDYFATFVHLLHDSFASVASLKDKEEAMKYANKVSKYRDMLNSPGFLGGIRGESFSISIPNDISDVGDLRLCLDVPLLLSMNSNIYDEFNVDTGAKLNLWADNAYGEYHQLDYGAENSKRTIRGSQVFFNEFANQFVDITIMFKMVALDKYGDGKVYLVRKGDAFLWGNQPPSSIDEYPYLMYGGGKGVKWGGVTHVKSTEQGDKYECLICPYPPKGYSRIELELDSRPIFYVRYRDSLTRFTDWKLWSVPSAILIQAPKLWLSDRQGRKVSELSKERSERFTFSDATRESQDLDIHFSSGYRIPAVSPSIIYYPAGTMPDTIGKDRAYPTDYMLSAYMAQRFGRVYGSLPSRGYELSGTFAWEVFPHNRQYMDMEWIPVSREIDIQQGTEHGTYHQVRPYSSVTEHMLTPEVLEGERPLSYLNESDVLWWRMPRLIRR
ncbi:hypothetical protein [Porphyromonas sp.]